MWSESQALGVTLRTMRVALNMYCWQRWVGLGCALAEGIRPKRGVVAGCPLAMHLLALAYITALDAVVSWIPAELGTNITLRIYVDDFLLCLAAT